MSAWRRWAAWALAGIAATVSMNALAAPGSPNIPGAAQILFIEDFENRPDPSAAQALGSYRGGPRANGSSYSADPYWLDDVDCNGIVFSAANPSFLGCPNFRNSFDDLREMARRMDILHGVTDPAAQGRNSVLAAFTIERTDGPPNGIVFEMTRPVPVPANRYITLNVDTAAVNCGTSQGRFGFYLLNGGVEQPLFSSSVTPCPLIGGRLKGNAPVISSGGSVGLRVRNETVAWLGNDAALDNIALLDVTPQLDKQFAPGPLAGGAYGVNKPARMIFTITNRDDLLEKAGWGFRETLPAGLVIAAVSNLATTCGFASVPVATPGATVLNVVNGTLAARATSCTISVDVTSATPGTYTNTPANVSAVVGLDLPGNASVSFVNEPLIRLQKALGSSRLQAGDQFALTIASATGGNGTATTDGTGTTVTNSATLDPATAGVAYTLSETAAGTTVLGNYTSSYRCTNATPGGQAPSGSGTSFAVTPLPTDNLTCVFTNAASVADLQIVKTRSAASARSGGVIGFTLTATNAGPAAANNAVLRDVPGPGLDCANPSPNATCAASGGASCPAATLPVSSLTAPSGVAIPLLPAGGSVVVTMQCTVTATGRP